jgi:hypothetical protein
VVSSSFSSLWLSVGSFGADALQQGLGGFRREDKEIQLL